MYNRMLWCMGMLLLLLGGSACSRNDAKQAAEQITVADGTLSDSLLNSVTGNVTMTQLATFPSKVILTGLGNHRLVSVYKTPNRKKEGSSSGSYSIRSYSGDSGYEEDESGSHFMPGIDILSGFNLLNIAHYDLTSEQGNFFFNHPVLVKTLYYPAFRQDSLHNKPINRDYYLVSVYDEDTNKDTLISKKDLRRLYHVNASGTTKTLLIPADYSVIRSQYDSQNDLMYIFASHDVNGNGTQDEPDLLHVFWFSLAKPEKAKRLY